jgi:hypothetical protein
MKQDVRGNSAANGCLVSINVLRTPQVVQIILPIKRYANTTNQTVSGKLV